MKHRLSLRNSLPLLAATVAVPLLSSCGKKDAAPTVPADAAAALDQQASEFEETSFQQELVARRFENEGFVPLWDQLNQASPAERLRILAELPLDRFSPGSPGAVIERPYGISARVFSAACEGSLDRAEWQQFAAQFAADGWVVTHTDWHQASFQQEGGAPARSGIRFAIHATKGIADDAPRAEVKGLLNVIWREAGGEISPAEVAVEKVTISRRDGLPPFKLAAVMEGRRGQGGQRADMGAVSVCDLNGDGLPEIILGNANRVLWNNGGFSFDPAPLVPADGEFHASVTGIAADFTGDGRPDWLCDSNSGDLLLYASEGGRAFARKPQRIPLTEAPCRQPSCLTAGDIDRDGDLDLFFGQWRSLYEQMPDKFWDANDGYGNTLLLNDGTGVFTDATEAAGLGSKRARRTYSASFYDADSDGDLDLLVVSDFSGPDLWINDGKGSFRDTTDAALPNRHTFGMSHAFADLNVDGHLDFVAFGMGSTTARRLDGMKAAPGGHDEANRMRGQMGYGNRTFLSQNGGSTYTTPDFAAALSRTGWTWGSTALDFDNDGDPDLYAGNGHISGSTTRDYCSNFWCRDIYLMPKIKTPAIQKYLDTMPAARTQSWDGYQVNALLVNDGGRDFQDASWLLGAGLTFDTRRVISADLDADGLMELIVERMEGTSGFQHVPAARHEPPALVVLRNTGSAWAENRWVGVHLQGTPGCAPWGASAVLTLASGKKQAAAVVTGDSFMCQHPATRHFGLGNGSDAPAAIEVRWPNGNISRLEDPQPGRYHTIRPDPPEK